MRTYETILNLSNNPSILEKLNILQNNKDDENLKKYFQYCLDGSKKYNIKKIPSYSGKTTKSGMDEVFQLLDDFNSRKYTGNAAIEKLTNLLENCDSETAQLLIWILSRKPHCGVSVQLVNKIWNNLIPLEIKLMKAQAYSLKALEEIHFPAISQRKCDGARCLAFCIDGKVALYSSGNKEFHSLDALKNDIKKLYKNEDFVLDGELLAVRDGKVLSRKEGNGLLNKSIHNTIPSDESDLITMVCWDYIPYENYSGETKTKMNQKETYDFLKKMVPGLDHLSLVESKIVNSKEELVVHFRELLQRGEEGVVVKNFDAHWEGKRSKNCVKMKIIQEFTLELTNIIEGNDRLSGTTGAIELKTSDGIVTVKCSGMTDAERKYFWENKETLIKNHTLCEIICNGIIKNEQGGYSLFLPRFVEIREKIEGADSFEYVKQLSDGSQMLID